MQIQELAARISDYLETLPQVCSHSFYGSLQYGNYDQYSDLDIQIDVSGIDNSRFLLELPGLLSKQFSVIFYDYAPSLAPQKYLVTVAVDSQNPFLYMDFACIATPHFETVSRQDLQKQNNPYDHMLKLFVANLKHWLRGADCRADIEKLYLKVFPSDQMPDSESVCLQNVYFWLRNHALPKYLPYLDSCYRMSGWE
ncbi:MAG: hypothetical protein ACOX6P_02865 [Candidatus Merdivicinus sp.]|jgi:predicted nucleotidyltransferase